MFDFDNFREIWSTVKKNKLRTFLTGFSVAWGIFMLIVLLGAGNGLGNGIFKNFERWGSNRVEAWTRSTSKPYKGMQANRWIEFKNEDYYALSVQNPEVELKTMTIYHSDTLSYGQEYNTYRMHGVSPDKSKIDRLDMLPGNGRFINDIDVLKRRKVIVISPRMKEVLFKGADPLGKYVDAGSLAFQVIGIYTDEDNSNDAPAYLPFTTAQTLYRSGSGFDDLTFTVKGINTEEEFDAFKKRFRTQMARRHTFDPDDERAIGMWGTMQEFSMLQGMINGINLFIWVIGLGTLTAGIVGVSNIMLITVRERTREFGIRKALGATPFSILKLIIVESILITAIFGYIGMIAGIGLTEGVNAVMEATKMGQASSGDDLSIFLNPTVSLGIAIGATILIIVAGVLAGYFPARKAVKITAIEAMRTE